MRKARKQRSQTRKLAFACKLGILALASSMAIPGTVLAAEKSCNPDLDFTILNEGPFFVGETLRISANLGARDIVGGTSQQISAFGFAKNCHLGEDYQNCEPEGHTVVVAGNGSTDCKGPNNEELELLFPQGNKVPITTNSVNGLTPISTGPNEQCNVQFDMRVDELADGTKRVVQAMGWPFTGEKSTLCDNGLTSTASSTIAFNVETCDIDLQKEVWSEELQDWVDADDEVDAVPLSSATGSYRLVITNTGTAGYVQDITVSDPDLKIDTTYPFPTDSNQLILTDSELAALTQNRCLQDNEQGYTAVSYTHLRAHETRYTISYSVFCL